MAITPIFVKGSIFTSPATMLVNPVNTVGVMGAGLAAQFKTKYPKNFKHYQKYCKSVESFQSFGSCVFEEKDKIVYNLPTKDHYRDFSSLGKLRTSLLSLVDYLNSVKIDTIAIPPLGAGLGGLNPMTSLHLILYYLRRVEQPLRVELYGFKLIPATKFHIAKQYDYHYRELDCYCGVGSRTTDYLGGSLIEFVGSVLNCNGYTLSTGDAPDGADLMFWTHVESSKFRFGPVGRKPRPDTIIIPQDDPNYAKAKSIAAATHPAWRFLPEWMKELHIRNAFQVLGSRLDSPVEFVLCWTPDGAETTVATSRKTGGTGTAIRIADRFGIPVFNLKNEDAIDRLGEFIGVDFRTGYTNAQRQYS